MQQTMRFFIKMGIAVGGALGGWLLAGIGYQADVTQTEETKGTNDDQT